MLICSYILTIKALSALLIKAAVAIFILILQFVTHILISWLYPSPLKLSTLSLMLIQLILSHMGNQDLLECKSSHCLSSLMSFLPVFFMPRLAFSTNSSSLTLFIFPQARLSFFKLATCVVKVTVGGTSVPSCPTCHQTFLSPLKPHPATSLITPSSTASTTSTSPIFPSPTIPSPIIESTALHSQTLPPSSQTIKAHKPQSRC